MRQEVPWSEGTAWQLAPRALLGPGLVNRRQELEAQSRAPTGSQWLPKCPIYRP